MTDYLPETRRDYLGAALRRADLPSAPLEQFTRWLDQAVAADLPDATAMALATSSAALIPSVRTVLLKHVDASGLCWYTDYRSPKGQDLAVNPVACVMFLWRELSRQVRITGHVEKLDAAASREYFMSRPEESRFSAAASVQSAPIADRESLERAVGGLRRQYPSGDVPPPEQWGGYRLEPQVYEFWQGREGRLHDRFRYQQTDSGWEIVRLQP